MSHRPPMAICLFCLADGDEASPLLRGCACRGSAGFGHMRCFVQAGSHNPSSWRTCPVCKQQYTGALQLGLAQAHWAQVRGLEGDDWERMDAASDLAQAHVAGGDFDAALMLREELVQTGRQALGDGHPATLGHINNLGSLYLRMSQFADAAPLLREALVGWRSEFGNEHPNTIVAMVNLAGLYHNIGDFSAATELLQEGLTSSREAAALGEYHTITLTCINNLAGLHKDQGQYAAACQLFEESLAGLRRTTSPECAHYRTEIDTD